jgi:BirA family biotin operon repressor/biotin-[acetyl-CoA-carboxylase] ligase
LSALAPDRIERELLSARYGKSLQHRARTASTNDDARAAIGAAAPNGHCVVADAQEAGRGSRGRDWESPAGTDLYVSIVDRLPVALAELPPLTLAVGLGVADAVDRLLGPRGGAPSRVKWPNDVLIAGRKCAGVLIETTATREQVDAVVIGIGLNVNRTEFAGELAVSATSLWLATPDLPAFDRNLVLCALLEQVERRVDEFVRAGALAITQALNPRLALLGRRARCDERVGIVRGIDPSGALRLQTAEGEVHVVAGRLEALEPFDDPR